MSKYFPCPCESKELYQKCCKRYHDGALPSTAEQLMRSRFSAYALGLADYIMATTHPGNEGYNKNSDEWRQDILRFCQATSFAHLRILEFTDGPQCAFVRFRAELTQLGRDASFEEKSMFLKEDGRWLYVSGVTTDV